MDIDRLKKLSPDELKHEMSKMTSEERLKIAVQIADNLSGQVAKAFPQGAAIVARGQSISTVDYAALAKREIDRIRAMR